MATRSKMSGSKISIAKKRESEADRGEMHTVDERVQDRHGTVGDTSVGVNLLEDLVDVRGVGLLSGLGALLLSSLGTGSLLASLL